MLNLALLSATRLHRSEYAASEIGDGSISGAGDEGGPCEGELLPELPPSWVPKLAIPRDVLDMRCPRVRGSMRPRHGTLRSMQCCASRRWLRATQHAPNAHAPLRPQGARTTLYRRCSHEIFAGFGECARWDGLVERLTVFADDARHVVAEVWGRQSPHRCCCCCCID